MAKFKLGDYVFVYELKKYGILIERTKCYWRVNVDSPSLWRTDLKGGWLATEYEMRLEATKDPLNAFESIVLP